MKSYMMAISEAAVCLLLEALLAMMVYVALKYTTTIENSALWIGCCILAGCLFIGVMLAALVGNISKNGK